MLSSHQKSGCFWHEFTFFIQGKFGSIRYFTPNNFLFRKILLIPLLFYMPIWEDFNRPKIVWAETMRIKRENKDRFPRFSYIDKPIYTDKTCFMAVGEELYVILAMLNSMIGRYQLSQTVAMMDNGGYLMQKIYIEAVRIPTVTSVIADKIKDDVIRLLDSKLSLRQYEILEQEIDKLVFTSFGLTPNEQKYVNWIIAQELGKRTSKS